MILQGFARIMTMRWLVAQSLPAGVFCALASLCALAQVRPLELGKAGERELAGGAQHSYQLQLSAGQFLHIIVDQRGIAVAVKLLAAAAALRAAQLALWKQPKWRAPYCWAAFGLQGEWR